MLTASLDGSTAVLTPAATAVATGAPFAGGVARGPRVVLRLEGAAVLVAAVVAYALLGGSWGWFAALFLVPDAGFLGYLVGPRFGAATYNAAHSYLGALLMAGLGLALGGSPMLLLGACIWAGHVGFDRMLGYGLKYASGFLDTHLGRIGKVRTGKTS